MSGRGAVFHTLVNDSAHPRPTDRPWSINAFHSRARFAGLFRRLSSAPHGLLSFFEEPRAWVGAR
jgi:hypothetical protein